MMAEVTAQQGNSFWRAVRALLMCVARGFYSRLRFGL